MFICVYVSCNWNPVFDALLLLSPHQGTAHGEGPAASLFPIRHPNWPKFWATSRWLANSNSSTGRLTTSTCGSGPSLSPLSQEAESDRCSPACWRDSSERWGTGTGDTESSDVTSWPLKSKKRHLKLSFVPPSFWWEREGVFTGTQRRRLHGVSLSRVICDNSHITHVPADPFSRTESPEDMLACSHPLVPHLDLSPWKEADTGEEVEKKTMCCQVCLVLSRRLASLPDPSCGLIPRIHSGYSLLCDSIILYQCHSGFILLGSSSISCDPSSQQWSPTPPTCQGMETKAWWRGWTR